MGGYKTVIMKIEAYTIQVILSIMGSVGFGSFITWVSNKNKNKAETQNLIGKTYGDLIDDLRAQVKYQGDQIKVMQERELELIKIITGHQEVERELRLQIKSLESKLSLRITKIEDNQ